MKLRLTSRDAVQIEESADLSEFQIPMQPIPERVEAALAKGVQTEPLTPPEGINDVLDFEGGGDGLVDTAVRQPDGTLVVAVRTEMPGVTSVMWDWWFGWHSYASARYRLWHPKAHLEASLAEDRRSAEMARDGWVGNISYVDEYIGEDLQRLAIRFMRPAEFGLDEAKVDACGVAFCAYTTVRRWRLTGGQLIHLVQDTDEGCVMHSRFRLGIGELHVPLIGPIVDWLINRRWIRRFAAPDEMGLALLRHCSEEMNHLARILPAIYERFRPESSAT